MLGGNRPVHATRDGNASTEWIIPDSFDARRPEYLPPLHRRQLAARKTSAGTAKGRNCGPLSDNILATATQRRSNLVSFKNRRDALAKTDAHGRQTELGILGFHQV